jgi:hypothetical protein
MTKYFSSGLILVLFFASLSLAQDAKDFPSITVEDIPGGIIKQESIFDGNSLWGHIDGGADVYLEYGFDKLLFQDISWKGYSFRVEFYKMIDTESAYGIMSISTFKCSERDTITRWICISPFQVQAAVGKYYISIANDKGNKEVEQLTVALFEKILSKQKEILFELPKNFANELIFKNRGKVKYIKGDLGLQNGFSSWQEMFSGFSGYNIFILPLNKENTYSNLAKIDFKSNIDAVRFINSTGIKFDSSQNYFSSAKGKELREVKMISEKEFYYCESNGSKSCLNQLLQ